MWPAPAQVQQKSPFIFLTVAAHLDSMRVIVITWTYDSPITMLAHGINNALLTTQNMYFHLAMRLLRGKKFYSVLLWSFLTSLRNWLKPFSTMLPILQMCNWPVADELGQKHPCLQESGSFNGCYGWQQQLKYKMANYRSKQNFWVPWAWSELSQKETRTWESSCKNVKKLTKAEVNYLPPHPQG